MSLADLYRADRAKPTETSSFTCLHYDAPPGEKRCRHYLKNGSCARPDELMCIEFLKANGHAVPASAPGANEPAKLINSTPLAPKVATDLFGNPLPDPPKLALPPAKLAVSTAAPKTAAPADPPIVRNVSDEEIKSFKDLSVEVCIASEALGEIWIVPEYTGAERKEISVEHAATLTAICAAFPGAKVVQYEKAKPQPPTEPAS